MLLSDFCESRLRDRASAAFFLGGIRWLVCLLCWVDLRGTLVVAQDFRRDVLPILSEHCFACHGFDEVARQGGLRLDTSAGALAGGDSGEAAIVPSQPGQSLLLQRIEAVDASERMPPTESGQVLSSELSPAQRQTLRQWIEQGALYQQHWAFEPPRAAPVPDGGSIAIGDGSQHPIDGFVRTKLREAGLSPAPPAAEATLLRRVSLDLTGLPPTPDELDEFLAACATDRQQAYLQAVERLLDSPHYGERWGRWWLDQARYADSNGYSIDSPRQIWKYRDWVIAALNDDMPFDQFTIEQLAGDLLPDATEAQRIATGFHRNTQINQEGGIDVEQFRIDSVFDRVATTGTVWLGLTVGCAQCHDHKFDPISQREYYQLFAFFNSQDEPTLEVSDARENQAELEANLEAATQELDAFIAEHDADYQAWEQSLTSEQIGNMSAALQQALKTSVVERGAGQRRALFNVEVGKIDSDYQTLKQRFDTLSEGAKGVTTTLVLAESAQPRTTTVFIKGDFTRPADVVEPGTPSVLPPLFATGTSGSDAVPNTHPNRLDLARWIVSRDNPLMARVIVNRVWQVYFGRGLVETENDFGSLGTPPSHPELLDWLAVEFQSNHWSLKELQRAIVMSQTYQQSSADRAELRQVDPKNYLLGRQQRLRLDAELVRDVCLSACGLLSGKLGGPPVFPPIPEGVMGQGQVKRAWKVSQGEDRYRRGLYTFVFRATPPPSLSVFDAPDGFSSCTRRSRSNTPLQALTLLNDAGFFEFAGALEKIVLDETLENEGLKQAFRRCTSRWPSEDELDILRQLDALSAARTMLNLDETVTRE